MHRQYIFKKIPCKDLQYSEEMITIIFTTKIISDKPTTIEDVATDILQLSSYIHDKLTKEYPDYKQKPFYFNRSASSTIIEIEIDVPISIFNKRIVQSRIDYDFQNADNFEHIYNLKRTVFKKTYLYRNISEEITSISHTGNRRLANLMPDTIRVLRQYTAFTEGSNKLFAAGDNVYRVVWMLMKLHYDEGVGR